MAGCRGRGQKQIAEEKNAEVNRTCVCAEGAEHMIRS